MKRFCRWLFDGLAVLSLLLLIGVAGFGVQSLWIEEGVGYQNSFGCFTAISDRGELAFRCDTLNGVFRGWGHSGGVTGHTRAVPIAFAPPGPGMRWDFHLMGFSLENRQGGAIPTGVQTGTFWWPYWQIMVPHAAVALLAAVLPVLAIRRRLAERHIRAGYCRRCGYDLRATPDRCPECGTIAGLKARP